MSCKYPKGKGEVSAPQPSSLVVGRGGKVHIHWAGGGKTEGDDTGSGQKRGDGGNLMEEGRGEGGGRGRGGGKEREGGGRGREGGMGEVWKRRQG